MGKYIEKSKSTRVSRLKSSFGQDLIYAVSNGKIKTPKSILYPTVIKSLTNCTELIDITNRLGHGHGVSRSILEEMLTENAYKILNERSTDSVVIPRVIQENKFIVAVDGNIDRDIRFVFNFVPLNFLLIE